jgi:hypothetical protein
VQDDKGFNVRAVPPVVHLMPTGALLHLYRYRPACKEPYGKAAHITTFGEGIYETVKISENLFV